MLYKFEKTKRAPLLCCPSLYSVTGIVKIVPDFSECGHGKCKFCTPGHYLKLCVEGSLLPKRLGFELTVTVGDKIIYHKEISIANPPPICFNHIPIFTKVADVCIELYEVSLQNKSACVRVSFKILGKKINLKLGCFKIPLSGDLDTGADGNVVVFQQ